MQFPGKVPSSSTVVSSLRLRDGHKLLDSCHISRSLLRWTSCIPSKCVRHLFIDSTFSIHALHIRLLYLRSYILLSCLLSCSRVLFLFAGYLPSFHGLLACTRLFTPTHRSCICSTMMNAYTLAVLSPSHPFNVAHASRSSDCARHPKTSATAVLQAL